MAGKLDLNITARLIDKATAPLAKMQSRLNKTMDSLKQNWLKVAAAVYSAKKAFDIAEMGAVAEQIEKSYARMAESVGINAERLKRALIEAAGATINFSNVASQVSALMAQGLNADQIIDLMRQARAEAKLFGKTTEDAFRTMAGAITGGYTVTLKRNFGLMVDIGEATKHYAQATGKAKEELTSFEKTQAIANEILKQGATHLRAVNLELLSNYEKIQVLKAQWTSFLEATGQVLLKLFGIVSELWSIFKLGVNSIIRLFEKLTEKILRFYYNILKVLEKIPVIGKMFSKAKLVAIKALDDIVMHQQKLKTDSVNIADEIIKKWQLVFSKSSEVTPQAGEVLLQKSKQALDGVIASSEKAAQAGKKSFDALAEAAKSAASRIQGAFDDFFFDVFKGRIHGLSGLLTSFGDAVLRMMSNLAAMKFLNITGISGIFNSIGAGTAGAGSSIGIPTVPSDGMYYLHRGEEVVPRYKRGASGGINIVVNQVIQAWDANDVWRNRKVLSQGIAEEIKNNGQLRDIINRAR